MTSSFQDQCSGLISGFPNLNVHENHLRDLVKKQILIQYVWEGLGVCISSNLPGGGDQAAG